MSEHKCKGTCKTKFDDKAKKDGHAHHHHDHAKPANDGKTPEQDAGQKPKCCGNCKPKQ